MDLAPLITAIEAQDRNIARALDFLSPEREADRRRQFEAGMAELEQARADLRRALGVDPQPYPAALPAMTAPINNGE